MKPSYETHAYCSPCGMWLPLETTRCPECKQKVRHKSHHKNQVRKYKEQRKMVSLIPQTITN